MPGIVRKLLIYAGAQGLVLQPVNHRNAPSGTTPIKISYDDSAITSGALDPDDVGTSEPLEAHGIIGLLDLTIHSHLIAISGRKVVAHINQKPIYLITEVALIPLTSRHEAQRAISKAVAKHAKATRATAEDSESSDDESVTGSIPDDDDALHLPVESKILGTPSVQAPPGLVAKSTSFASDVIKDRGKYGRFADKWFSTAGWTSSGRSRQGMSPRLNDVDNVTREQRRQGLQNLSADDANLFSPSRAGMEMVDMTADGKTSVAQSEGDAARAVRNVMQTLSPRILSTTKMFFSSRSFYFAYDYDLTRSLTGQRTGSSNTPLCKDADPSFAWNRHLSAQLADAAHYSFVLPIIQGYVGQKPFTVMRTPPASDKKDASIDAEVVNPDKPVGVANLPSASTTHDFVLTLVSRRSAKRAGLRYLRRGVDDKGNVANYVETEQILSPSDSAADAMPSHSLMQLRGSIPLFFSQSPYSFKPVPILYGSEGTNAAAFSRHFSMLHNRFGKVAVNSLVDKHANEARIGELFQHHVELSNKTATPEDKLEFEWFDFHQACRGMKFENVSQLIDVLQPVIERFGWSELEGVNAALPLRQQQGVMRTNCMDCLDRTNVVQCAIASFVLQKQLFNLGFSIDLKSDVKTQWFNGLWADNGDAISRQYAGTAALKGDYTRTRKRAWTGALSDFSLTLHRFYNNMLGDYFLQTCIDYFQGVDEKSYGGSAANMFVDFETDMTTSDHAIDMNRLRQQAIDTCVKIVLEDPEKEDLVWAWTLAAPTLSSHAENHIHGPLEECVVLLTDAAIYKVQFDWSTEKPGRFERIDLLQITGLQRGVYITSTLGPAHLDEAKNRGLLVKYQPSTNDDAKADGLEVRTNTRSLGNEKVTGRNDPALPSMLAEKPDGAVSQDVGPSADKGQTATPAKPSKPDATKGKTQVKDTHCVLAFKALTVTSSASKTQTASSSRRGSLSLTRDASRRSSVACLVDEDGDNSMSEHETVQFITEEIKRLATNARRKAGIEDGPDNGAEVDIMDQHIVSVAQAKSRTSYLESLGYSIKKLVWS